MAKKFTDDRARAFAEASACAEGSHSVACGMLNRNAISNAVGYAKHRSRSHDAVIPVYDATGDVIETHEHKGDFKEW